MKKILSVLLAVILMFSTLTVGFMAFAEDVEEPATEETQEPVIDDEKVKEVADMAFNYFLGMTYDEFMALDGDAQWEAIKSMDMDKVMTLVKAAKFVLKFAKIGIKIINVLDKLGFIDLSGIKQMIVDAVVGAIVGAVVPGEDVPETTVPAIA